MAVAGRVVIVTGIREIDRNLRRLPGAVQKKVVRRAMRKGMKVLQAAVKAEVPVDKGIARRNVVVRAVRARRRGSISIEVRVNPNEQTRKTSRKTGKETFYPATVQYGRSGVRADPFMTRAFAEAGEAARQATLLALRDGVEREAAALGRGPVAASASGPRTSLGRDAKTGRFISVPG